ncbi:MAG: TolC family protein [Acidobacteria bacterium]|nr:MAG: TolC family protein [Acidobacteriota bacterium]
MNALLRVSKITVLGLVLASALTVVRGQPEQPDQKAIVRLEDLVSELLTNNPDIQAARKRFEAAETRPGQQSALPDPKIEAGWSSATYPLPGFGLGSEPTANLGFQLSQEIPFPGKRGLRGGMAAKEAESEGQTFRSTELEQVARLKSAFHELRFAYDAIDVLRHNQNLLQRLAKVAEARYSVGGASQQDLVRSEVEINLLDGRVIQLDQRKSSLEAEINRLLNRPVEKPLGRPEAVDKVPPLPPVESLQRQALARSPMLRSQRAMIDSRQLGVEMARKEYYPDFEVMGGYFYQGSMKDMWEFRVQLNIPIFFWKKQRLGLEEAGIRLTESQRSYRGQQQDLSFRVRDRYLAAQASERLMDLYSKKISPQSTLALESSLPSYETGTIDFLSVLSNFTAILESEFNFHEQKAEYLKALAEIDELTGRTGFED